MIAVEQISTAAVKVLHKLTEAGFTACLVGGSVRDLLLGRKPKDFDVATDALPEQITHLFPHARIIGRRFRLVHVYFRNEIIEVSTFRASVQEEVASADSLNNYGTMEEDAWRRDFTVNALYYHLTEARVDDYTGGLQDLRRHQLRMIGDPVQRYHEDPVRLLRAIRLSAKLDFTIESATEGPLQQLAHLLQHVSVARLLDEVFKLFFDGHAEVTYKKLLHYGYLEFLFPGTYFALQQPDANITEALILLSMQETDRRFAANLSLNPSFLLAVLLWPVLQKRLQEYLDRGEKFHLVYHHAVAEALAQQQKVMLIPKRLIVMIRSIWLMQYQLLKLKRNRVARLAIHRYFRAAVDFLELRAQAGEPLTDTVQWWKKYRYANAKKRLQMVKALERKKE